MAQPLQLPKNCREALIRKQQSGWQGDQPGQDDVNEGVSHVGYAGCRWEGKQTPLKRPRLVLHIYNPSTQEVEVGESCVRGQLRQI